MNFIPAIRVHAPEGWGFVAGKIRLDALPTVRFAAAMNHTIGNDPGLRRIAVRPRAKRPAGEILAVEKLDVICGGDDLLCGTG
ncbi:MAG: hypothetical protein ABSG80_16645 [Verrucomicrobiota bacterium]